VIPTRERPRTLATTLRTCLAQEYDDCEILVSDNQSGPETREVVEGADDPRVRYVRTPRLFALSDSWAFALREARGEYLTVLGDDDGLLLHALPTVDRLLRLPGVRALRWDSVCYVWPDVPPQPFAAAHELLIPLGQTDHYFPIRRCDAPRMMRAAAHGEISYTELPSLYCAAVHRDLVEALGRRDGRTFRSRCPDVYSAFGVAYLAGTFHSVAAPMGISALSGRSTGVADLYVGGPSAIAQEFRRLSEDSGYAMHPSVPALSIMPALVADAFQHARQALFPSDDGLTLDRRRVVAECLAAASAETAAEWDALLAVIRHALRDDPQLQAWFDREHGARRPEAWPHVGRRTAYRRYGWKYLHLDASDFGLADVWDVACFCERLLGLKRDGVNAHLTPGRPKAAARARGWLAGLRRAVAGARRGWRGAAAALTGSGGAAVAGVTVGGRRPRPGGIAVDRAGAPADLSAPRRGRPGGPPAGSPP
jgi:hypothetical protein